MGKLITKMCLKILVVASVFWVSNGCRSPPAAVGFQNSRYYGVWYEVGKYETAGWSFFYRNCACTKTEIKAGQGRKKAVTATHSCRDGSPKGQFISKTGDLTREGPPGKWRESFGLFTRSINYTVVYMDDNFALEYDCETFLGMTNYCLHVLSRKPTIDDAKLDLLLKVVDEFDLNNHGKKYSKTIQKGCPH